MTRRWPCLEAAEDAYLDHRRLVGRAAGGGGARGEVDGRDLGGTPGLALPGRAAIQRGGGLMTHTGAAYALPLPSGLGLKLLIAQPVSRRPRPVVQRQQRSEQHK